MAAVFTMASAAVQANQSSSGSSCPSVNEPQNVVSLLQTKLHTNVFTDGDGGYLDGLELSWNDKWQTDLDAAVLSALAMPIMVVSTRHEVCMVDSFISHAENASLDTILHMGLDQESHAHCVDRSIKMTGAKLHCLDFSGWIPGLEGGPSGISNDNAGFNSVIFNKVAFSRVVLLKHAVQTARDGVLMIDADIVLHGDLPGFISQIPRSPGVQIMAASGLAPNHPNLGLIWVDKSSTDLLKRWLSALKVHGELNGGELDQDILLKTDGFWKSFQYIDLAVVGQCAQGGRLATHYNCVDSKITKMKEDGVWKPVANICQE